MGVDDTSGDFARPYPGCPAPGIEQSPELAEYRVREPLARVRLTYGDEAWLLTRYRDVRSALADPRFSRAATLVNDVPRLHERSGAAGSLLDLDPPEHTRLRRLVIGAMTVRRAEKLRPDATRTAAELLDAMERRGAPADLLADFALPLPKIVLCELLGVPHEGGFGEWLKVYAGTTAFSVEQRREYMTLLRDYVTALVVQRREEPADDLISALAVDREVTEEEVVDLVTIVLVAGFDTTAMHIVDSTLTLLAHPDQWRLLCENPDLVPNAVEELLRHVPLSTGVSVPRYAVADVPLSGGTVRTGEPVLLSREAANRDPEVFADPERLDITRDASGHLGFGHGPHFCAGAQLARMNLQVALTALVTRWPRLRLAIPPHELTWRTGHLVRGPVALPVAW